LAAGFIENVSRRDAGGGVKAKFGGDFN